MRNNSTTPSGAASAQTLPGQQKEKTRYSADELEEFEKLIVSKLKDAQETLSYHKGELNGASVLGDHDTRFSNLEDGTSTAEREYHSFMVNRQTEYIGRLEKALSRIKNKTYGICRKTGKLISKERLRAVPHATLCIEAKKVAA